MHNLIQSLSDEDITIIKQCLTAAVEGPFFPDWEFQTLFGVERNVVSKVLDSWPKQTVADKDLINFVVGSMGHLLGYPHGYDEIWSQYILVSHERVRNLATKIAKIGLSYKINKAIILYFGYGLLNYPSPNSWRVIEELGDKVGSDILSTMEMIIQNLDEIKIDWDFFINLPDADWQDYRNRTNSDIDRNGFTLIAATDWAVSKLREKYPEINDDAAEALKWAFSWGHK